MAWHALSTLLAGSAAYAADADLDGLGDGLELTLGTDPNRPDTDGDRFADGGEVRVLLTDPLLADPLCEWPVHPITGDSSVSLWPVDLDDDGDLDVLDENTPSAWENLGLGGFVEHPIANLSGGLAIRAGDLDGDGLADMVFTSLDWIWTARNLGGLAFEPPVAVAAVEGADTVAIDDLDLDGDLDLVAWSNTHDFPDVPTLGVMLANRGGGEFTPPRVFDADGYVNGVAVGDLDGDGLPDILVGGRDVWWYRNQGPGSPFSPRILISPWGPYYAYDDGLSIADLDGDGWNDVVHPDESHEVLTVLWNGGGGGGGAFGPSVVNAPAAVEDLPSAASAWPADADGDGDLDVFVQQGSPVHQLGWIENLGGRALAPVEPLSFGYHNAGVVGGDIDGDGDPDLLALGGDSGDVASWIENLGVGDPDGDGLDSRDEACFTGSDPQVADTDRGGVIDGLELRVGRDPLFPGDDGDGDGDGYPIPLDCDDSDPGARPGAPELCANGADDDCDGQVDESC